MSLGEAFESDPCFIISSLPVNIGGFFIVVSSSFALRILSLCVALAALELVATIFSGDRTDCAD